MADLFGTSPDLSASYTYARFNPVTGLTYKILPELMTFYAGYSEANRIPTPLELGCSNPLKPCLLEGFLVSDPPLQQVVARTREAGLRGNINTAGGRGDWTVSHRQPERHHTCRERASRPRRVPERARHPPPRAGGGRAVPDRP